MIITESKTALMKLSDDVAINVEDVIAVYKHSESTIQILFRGTETALTVKDEDGSIMNKIIAATTTNKFHTC